MTNTKNGTRYVRISESAVPEGVRFDCPRRNEGQMVLVEYGGFARREHDEGDEFKRVIDRSLGGKTTYFRMAP